MILYIKWINRFAIQWKGKKRQKFFSYLGPRGGAKADTNQTSHFPGARVWIPGPHPYIHVCELHFLFDLELQELYCSEYHIGYQCSSSSKLLQLCPTLGNPIDSSPPGSPIPETLQARTLEWVAISFSNAWKWKVKVKSLSRVWLLATPGTAAYQAPPSMGFSRQEYWSGVPLPSPTQAFRAALFAATLSIGKQPKCPLSGEQMNCSLLYVKTVEYYLAINRS